MSHVTVRQDGLITTDQAAELCGVKRGTIHVWIRRKQVPVAKRENGRVLLNLVDVARADHATRKVARRAPASVPSWSLDGEPDVDLLPFLAACDAEAQRVPPEQARQPVVYYLRFGDRIKIGTTIGLPARLDDVPHDMLLATEPGGREIERQRHDQLAALRITREWFRPDTPLLHHIAQIAHG